MICTNVFRDVQPVVLRRARLRGLILGLIICGSPVCVRSQVHSDSRIPDAQAGDERSPDAVWDMAPAQVAKPIKTLEKQLVTLNELRAPEKARSAIRKATKAIHDSQFDQAAKQIARALVAYPEYALAFTLRGILELRARSSDAEADLQRAISLDPSSGLPYAVLASGYNDAGRYQDALPLSLRAVQLLPAVWQSHLEMARTLFGRHQTVEALKEVTNAMRLSSDANTTSESRAALHFYRGRILVDLHEFAAARQEFELALHAEPQSSFGQTSSQILARLDAAAIH